MLTSGVTVKAAVQLKLTRITTAMRFLQKRQGQVCPDQVTDSSPIPDTFLDPTLTTAGRKRREKFLMTTEIREPNNF